MAKTKNAKVVTAPLILYCRSCGETKSLENADAVCDLYLGPHTWVTELTDSDLLEDIVNGVAFL